MLEEDDIINIIKKNTRLDAFWTEEDDFLLRKEIFSLTTEYMYSLEENEDLYDEDEIILDDLFEDAEESRDSLSFNIDDILTFDLDDQYAFNLYDLLFFTVTLLLLLTCNLFFIAIIYTILGIHMALKIDYDDYDAKEVDRSLALRDYSLKVFYLVDKMIEDPDCIEEPVNITDDKLYSIHKWFFNYTNSSLLGNESHLSYFKKNTIKKYKTFTRRYYSIPISFICSSRNKKDRLLLNPITLKKYDFKESQKKLNMSTNFNLQSYDYKLLYKDINFCNNLKLFKPQKFISYY